MVTTENTTTVKSLILALHKGDWSAWLPLLDLLEEAGCYPRDLKTLRSVKRKSSSAIESAEEIAIEAGIITWEDSHIHQAAVVFHKAVDAIDLGKVPLITQERLYRVELAKLARKLFTQLRLKGISVTAPNYSMAQSVDVKLPQRRDYRRVNGSVDWQTDPTCVANRECERKIEQILLTAFPGTDNRSDSTTDYFNYRWAIN